MKTFVNGQIMIIAGVVVFACPVVRRCVFWRTLELLRGPIYIDWLGRISYFSLESRFHHCCSLRCFCR
jgi:hypothetical protein